MTNHYKELLDILTRNDGACLYWQLPHQLYIESAVKAGIFKMEGDLLIHPDAIEIEQGHAYTLHA